MTIETSAFQIRPPSFFTYNYQTDIFFEDFHVSKSKSERVVFEYITLCINGNIYDNGSSRFGSLHDMNILLITIDLSI